MAKHSIIIIVSWFSKIKIQTTIEDDSSVRVFDYYLKYQSSPMTFISDLLLYNYVVKAYS